MKMTWSRKKNEKRQSTQFIDEPATRWCKQKRASQKLVHRKLERSIGKVWPERDRGTELRTEEVENERKFWLRKTSVRKSQKKKKKYTYFLRLVKIHFFHT